MKSVNEQFAEMQKKTLESLEPMQNMNAVAAEAFERIARKNYDLMGDLVDYAVAQVKTPTNPTNLQEAYEQRVAETKAFAEKVNARAAEYVTLAGELGDMAKSKAPAASKAKASSDEAAPAKAKSAKSAEAAPAKAESAKATPAKTESAKAAPAKTESAKAESAKTAPAKAESDKAGSAKTKAAPAKTASTAKSEGKAAPATAKKKATAKKTAAKSK